MNNESVTKEKEIKYHKNVVTTTFGCRSIA